MSGIGYRVVVKPQAEIECQAWRDHPLIANKPCKFVLADGEICGRTEFDSLQCRARDPTMSTGENC